MLKCELINFTFNYQVFQTIEPPPRVDEGFFTFLKANRSSHVVSFRFKREQKQPLFKHKWILACRREGESSLMKI